MYSKSFDVTCSFLTFQIHASLQTLAEATSRAVFPPNLVDDAVVSPCAQIVVLS